MKKEKRMWGTLVLLLVFALAISGCVSHDTGISGGANAGATFAHVNVSAQGFQSLGLVFAETEVQISRRWFSSNMQGEALTFNALAREAHALGADAIINVTIDRVVQTRGRRFYFILIPFPDQRATREIWQGSALAVRYTGSLSRDYHQSGITYRDGPFGAGFESQERPGFFEALMDLLPFGN